MAPSRCRTREGRKWKPPPFDAFVVRLNETGLLDYATYLGGRLNDFGEDIALDKEGNVVVVGTTSSDDFPGFNSNLLGQDGFIAVLDLSSLTPVAFSAPIGGGGQEVINSVAIDTNENIYVAGTTNSGFLPANFLVRGELESEPFQPLHAGPGNLLEPYGSDGFVVRLELDGDSATYHYATFLGGSGADRIWDIDVDASGSAFVTGETNSADFPVRDTVAKYQGMFTDAFVSKLSPSGRSLVYSTVLGGSSTDVGAGIAVDPSGSAHITGWTSNIVCTDPMFLTLPPEECPFFSLGQIPGDFLTQSAFQEEFHGGYSSIVGIHPKDAFVAKFTDASLLSGISQDVHAAVPFTEPIATFFSPRLDAEAGDFMATIDWGDGSPLDKTGDIREFAFQKLGRRGDTQISRARRISNSCHSIGYHPRSFRFRQ